MNRNYFFAILSGVCLAIATVTSLWPAVLVGIALFLHLLRTETSKKRLLLLAWVVGTIHMLAAIHWFWAVYGNTSLFGFDLQIVQGLALGVVWAGVSIVLGLGLRAVAWLQWHLKSTGWLFYALFPVSWLLGEIFGSVAFWLFSYGPGSNIFGLFSFGYVGYAIADVGWFLSIATLYGVFSLSLYTEAAAVSTYVFLVNRQYVLGGILLCVLGILPGLFPMPVVEAPETAVITVRTQMPPEWTRQLGGYERRERVVLQAVSAALLTKVPYVVLPEDARFTNNFEDTEDALAFIQNQAEHDVVVIDSLRTVDERGKVILRAYMYDTATNKVYITDKQTLVPQGEFLPFLSHGLMTMVLPEPALRTLERNKSYVPGKMTSYAEIPETIPGVLFCMEVVTPLGARNIADQHEIPFLAHIISHTNFGGGYQGLQHQLERMLRVHAIWSGIPIAVAANDGFNITVYADGRVEETPMIAKGAYWSLHYEEL